MLGPLAGVVSFKFNLFTASAHIYIPMLRFLLHSLDHSFRCNLILRFCKIIFTDLGPSDPVCRLIFAVLTLALLILFANWSSLLSHWLFLSCLLIDLCWSHIWSSDRACGLIFSWSHIWSSDPVCRWIFVDLTFHLLIPFADLSLLISHSLFWFSLQIDLRWSHIGSSDPVCWLIFVDITFALLILFADWSLLISHLLFWSCLADWSFLISHWLFLSCFQIDVWWSFICSSDPVCTLQIDLCWSHICSFDPVWRLIFVALTFALLIPFVDWSLVDLTFSLILFADGSVLISHFALLILFADWFSLISHLLFWSCLQIDLLWFHICSSVCRLIFFDLTFALLILFADWSLLISHWLFLSCFQIDLCWSYICSSDPVCRLIVVVLTVALLILFVDWSSLISHLLWSCLQMNLCWSNISSSDPVFRLIFADSHLPFWFCLQISFDSTFALLILTADGSLLISHLLTWPVLWPAPVLRPAPVFRPRRGSTMCWSGCSSSRSACGRWVTTSSQSSTRSETISRRSTGEHQFMLSVFCIPHSFDFLRTRFHSFFYFLTTGWGKILIFSFLEKRPRPSKKNHQHSGFRDDKFPFSTSLKITRSIFRAL